MYKIKYSNAISEIYNACIVKNRCVFHDNVLMVDIKYKYCH